MLAVGREGAIAPPYEMRAVSVEGETAMNAKSDMPAKVWPSSRREVEPLNLLPPGLLEAGQEHEDCAVAWGNSLFYNQANFPQHTAARPPAPLPPQGAAAVWLQPGAWVRFQGLKAALELNGQDAIVERWDLDSGRWVVRTWSGEAKFAKADNLEPSQTPQAVAGPGFSGGSGQGGRLCAAGPAVWPAPPGLGPQPPRSGRGPASISTTAGTGSRRSSVCEWASDGSGEGNEIQQGQGGNALAVGRHVAAQAGSGDWSLSQAQAQTTVMMRNLPVEYTRSMLVELLNREGFCGTFDLVYLPMNFGSMQGFGYSFINLVSVQAALRFRTHFQGFSDWQVVSEKTCEVSWSNVLQGRQAHIERYRNSPLMHPSVPDEFKPACFVGGRRIVFPPPTQRVKAPRHRKEPKCALPGSRGGARDDVGAFLGEDPVLPELGGDMRF